MDAIRTFGLTKFYGSRRGIEDLDLEVRVGEVFGFLGPNGAGKTTTIRLLIDVIRPTRGRAEVLGLDSTAGSVEIHRRVGFLPGEPRLPERLTGRKLLEHLAALRGGVDPARRDEVAARLDLDLDVPVGSYSTGNRQKVLLVQALMHRPELLVLDEPTSGLDPLKQQEFYRLVEEHRAGGGTVFLSSHVLPEVERVADRVGIVRDGRLVVVEQVAALKARALRTVEFHFVEVPPAGVFDGVTGVQSVARNGQVVQVTVAGSMDGVVKAAARHRVDSVISHEADLEDVFLDMYRDGPDG